MHNNPLIYVDPYGLWGESLQGCWDQTKEFGHSFARGFADDMSYGATELALGEHQTPTFNSKAAYYTGTGCSHAAGMFCGTTWAKGAIYGGKALNYGFKALKTAFQSTKSIRGATKIVDATASASASAKALRSPAFSRLCLKQNDDFFNNERSLRCHQKTF